MASILPFTFVCFIACLGGVLSTWSRRSSYGAVTVVALTAAVWGGIWMRALQGDSTLSVGLSFALLMFVPALVLMAVQDHLAQAATHRLLRRVLFIITCAFAALAATSGQHNLFISLDPAMVDLAAGESGIRYLVGSYVALAFAFGVSGLAIYTALVDAKSSGNLAIRNIVFVAFPLVLLVLGLGAVLSNVTISGMNPVLYGVAVACALGPWLLSHFEFAADDSVRNLLFARLPDPVVALDDQQRIVDCNDAFADLLDNPVAELHGSLLREVVSKENYVALSESDGQNFELRWDHGDSVIEHYAVVALALESDSTVRVLHLTESDSHKHAQQALETADFQLEQANASLDRLKFNDELTGLSNQRRFVDELEREIARHQRSGLRFGVISIEADHFNLLAEQHGSAFRDRSLALIARAIEVEVRDTDLCARLDGEEFAVIAVQMKVPGLVNLAERIRKRVLKVRPHAPGGERVRMSVSLGVGVFEPKKDDLRGLLARTNRYLAEAKRSGRNQVVSGD